MSTHRITVAEDVRSGAANSINRVKIGVPLGNVVRDDLGTPTVADTNEIAASQTVTGVGTAFALNGAGVSGVTIANGVATLATPRNITGAWTNSQKITITGTDVYGQAMTETTASAGTSHTGKKAFKTVSSVTTDGTITGAIIGYGDVLGVNYRVAAGGFIQGAFDGVKEATQGTFVAADATTATATTGDVRGTYDPNGTLDGTKRVVCYYVSLNGPTDADGFGITQA